MKKATLTIIATLVVCLSYSQLLVDSTSNYQALVDNFILTGVSATNVVYTGAPAAVGSFSNGATTNLGMTDGIVHTTGVIDAVPPIGSDPSGFLSAANGTLGDADLDAILAGMPTYDASVLEFDLIPVGNILEFQYVFASEEYPEFVNSSFNDLFGFFISGQNPLGGNYAGDNIALIPGSNMPVSINNVHVLVNSAFYVANGTLPSGTIAFDGFTTVLVAQIAVVAGQSYHLKMAVADAADMVYDSGIFLKAQSMKSYNLNTIADLASHDLAIPNPLSRGDEFSIALDKGGRLDMQLFDCSGRIVSELSFDVAYPGQHTFNMNDIFGNSPGGLYFLNTTFDNRRETVKLILE